MKKYYHNSKTGEIGEYEEQDAGYSLKGLLYAYGDAITLGLKNIKEAKKWAKKWGYCPKCKSTSSGKNNKCFRCGTKIQFVK